MTSMRSQAERGKEQEKISVHSPRRSIIPKITDDFSCIYSSEKKKVIEYVDCKMTPFSVITSFSLLALIKHIRTQSQQCTEKNRNRKN